MSRKFILQTQSGSVYELFDETHLFGSDHWSIMYKGKKKAVLCFGDLRQAEMNPAMGRATTGKPIDYMRALEGQIGKAIQSNACIGKVMFYIDESNFASAIKGLEELRIALSQMNRERASRIWNILSKAVGYTSKIIRITHG